jgi:hypothetical protein
MTLSRKTLLIGAGLVLAVAFVVVLIATTSGGGGGGY